MTRLSVKRYLGLAAVLTVASASSALAQSEHTTYATTKGGCAAGPNINWTSAVISGPGFACDLNGSVSVGTGLAGYNGTCNVAGQTVDGIVVFGLSIPPPNDDHFNVTLPNSISHDMYPCTPVDGLAGTN
jgi:hypothetical protein